MTSPPKRPITTRVDLTPSQMASLKRVGWVWAGQGLGAWLVARAREASDLRRDLDEAGHAALLDACKSDDLRRAVPLTAADHEPCASCGGGLGWRLGFTAGSTGVLRCEQCRAIARWLVRGLNGEVLALPEGAVPTHVRQARAHREARVETDAEIERLTALLERQRGAVLLRAGGGYGCPVPGAEAEDLRREIEALAEQDTITGDDLQALLDRVDARDSLAYLEAHDAE